MKLDEFIDGSMLGDGTLRIRHNNRERNARYQMSQVTTHTDYVLWIKQLLEDAQFTTRLYTIPAYTKITSKGVLIRAKESYRLETRISDRFTPHYHRWYTPEGDKWIKHVPDNLQLTYNALVVWIMDDGSAEKRKNQIKFSTALYTMAFNEHDLDILKTVLYRDLNINPTISKHHGKNILRISAKDTGNIYSVAKDVILQIAPSFNYKFEPKSPDKIA